MADPDFTSVVLTRIDKLIDLFGVVIFNFAGIVILASHVTLGELWSGELETKANHQLINTGPYEWVRHPLYSSYFLLTLGLFAMSGNWLVGVSMLVYFATVAARTPKEEAMLVERLGQRYAEYQKVTGRFVPRLGHGRAAGRNLESGWRRVG
jgi:protein-S-isoprenylcysteine O-methyltransferase Ste14